MNPERHARTIKLTCSPLTCCSPHEAQAQCGVLAHTPPMPTPIDLPPSLDTPPALTVIETLRTELAVLQEAVQRVEVHEAPILTARYLATLGEREYKLLQLQVDVRAYRRRIELAQAVCNRGHKLDLRAVADIDASVNTELQEWHQALKQREQDLVLAHFNLKTMQLLPDDEVQRAKQAYRQLARWLHPDAHPENAALFARFWPAVQSAYRACDVDELETLVQVIARELPDVPPVADDEALAQHLKELIAAQARQLADLQAQPPMCYRVQLDDAVWVARRCAEMDLAIHLEAAQLAALVGRFADLTASAAPGQE